MSGSTISTSISMERIQAEEDRFLAQRCIPPLILSTMPEEAAFPCR